MTTPALDTRFADAIENELTALGTKNSRLERNQRHARGITAVIGTVAAAGALTGGAIVISNLPGETTTTPIGDTVSGTYTGTANVDLGPVPAGAGAVILDVTCTEGGAMTVTLNGGSNGDRVSWDCGDPIRNDTVHINDGKLPATGTTAITITAEPGTRWSVTAQYATTTTTDWAVNENGQTYGVPNGGLPDLQIAQATNGEQGYILTAELLSVEGDGTINVYESDGTTIIGRFHIGNNS